MPVTNTNTKQVGLNRDDIADLSTMKGIDKNLLANYKSTVTPVNTVSATNLGQAPYKTPPVTPTTGYDGLIASTNAAITNLQPDVEQGKADIKSKYDRLGALPAEKADAYKTEGVYEKQGIYNKMVNTINQKELGYQTRIDKIRNENPTGQLTEGQTIAMDKLSKDWAIEKAGLSISAAFAKDDYTLAKTIVDDRIAAETEGLTNELEGLKYFYTENAGNLSDERKNLLQYQIKTIEDEKAAKEQALSEIGAIQLAAAENGAPSDVVVAIGKASDLTTAISSAGSWIDQTIDRDGTGGTGSGEIDLAPEDERILTGAGYSAQDIKDIKKAVAQFGIQSVLDNETNTAKKNAIKKVYGIGEPLKTRADAEAEVASKGVDLVLKTVYTTEELKKMADEAGVSSWWKTGGTDIKNYLKSDAAKQKAIELYIQKYQKEGIYGE